MRAIIAVGPIVMSFVLRTDCDEQIVMSFVLRTVNQISIILDCNCDCDCDVFCAEMRSALS